MSLYSLRIIFCGFFSDALWALIHLDNILLMDYIHMTSFRCVTFVCAISEVAFYEPLNSGTNNTHGTVVCNSFHVNPLEIVPKSCEHCNRTFEFQRTRIGVSFHMAFYNWTFAWHFIDSWSVGVSLCCISEHIKQFSESPPIWTFKCIRSLWLNQIDCLWIVRYECWLLLNWTNWTN